MNAATVPPAVRAAVIERDGGCCQRCGIYCGGIQSSLQHRKPRKAGGRKGQAAVESYDMANLILVCGTATSRGGCHLACESDRNQAYDDGWLVREHEDPAVIPVLTYKGWLYVGPQWTEERRG